VWTRVHTSPVRLSGARCFRHIASRQGPTRSSGDACPGVRTLPDPRNLKPRKSHDPFLDASTSRAPPRARYFSPPRTDPILPRRHDPPWRSQSTTERVEGWIAFRALQKSSKLFLEP
jgi:hypothetical protein